MRVRLTSVRRFIIATANRPPEPIASLPSALAMPRPMLPLWDHRMPPTSTDRRPESAGAYGYEPIGKDANWNQNDW
jgi:hypothetical protein